MLSLSGKETLECKIPLLRVCYQYSHLVVILFSFHLSDNATWSPLILYLKSRMCKEKSLILKKSDSENPLYATHFKGSSHCGSCVLEVHHVVLWSQKQNKNVKRKKANITKSNPNLVRNGANTVFWCVLHLALSCFVLKANMADR